MKLARIMKVAHMLMGDEGRCAICRDRYGWSCAWIDVWELELGQSVVWDINACPCS